MKLEDLRGWMGGEDALVVGCGPSACEDSTFNAYEMREPRWTFACNRSVSCCYHDFAVCVEPFVNPIWPIMREASPLIVFSHICEDRRGKKPHPRIVQIGSKDVREWLPDTHVEPLTLNQSPFFGAAVAAFMGFETIGLIGVDLTEDRYPDVTKPNKAWGRLATVIESMGSRLINLNPESRLETVPMGEWGEIRTK